ncbi:MAG: tyrosine-type recombinase/integrase [Propionibacteriaceae bacterium]|nr:tyrosine-type recombinase/integrase [Propionibacteriaceae bacterium]
MITRLLGWFRARVPRQVTVGELVERWLATKVNLSVGGFGACRAAAARVWRYFGGVTPAALTTSAVRQWSAAMAVGEPGRPASQSTRAKALECLRGSLEIGVEAGVVRSNPAVGVKAGRSKRRPVRALEPEQVAALARACGKHGPLIWLLATCGLRIGEACALNVGDVNLARGRLNVKPGKTGKGREVALPRFVAARLDLTRPPDRPLFTSLTGGQLDPRVWRRQVFGPAKVVIGQPGITPHCLRHTAASLAIQAGADVKAVQAMLGHASAAMTLDTYAHLWDHGLDDVARRFDRLMGDLGRSGADLPLTPAAASLTLMAETKVRAPRAVWGAANATLAELAASRRPHDLPLRRAGHHLAVRQRHHGDRRVGHGFSVGGRARLPAYSRAVG